MIKYVVRGFRNPQSDENAKVYGGKAKQQGVLGLQELSHDISVQCTATEHDVKGVILALEEQVMRHVVAGKSVRLGDFGSFCPRLQGSGEAVDKVSPRLAVRFTPSRGVRKALRLGNGSRVKLVRHVSLSERLAILNAKKK
ncbi:MAG: hypothetical protein Q4A44_05335 [Bacteroidales bacterium]|nr:hypothetical protein [Bacteroidales bacterium]